MNEKQNNRERDNIFCPKCPSNDIIKRGVRKMQNQDIKEFLEEFKNKWLGLIYLAKEENL